MRISVYTHSISKREPCVRQVDVLFYIRLFDLEGKWYQYIYGQAHVVLVDGDRGIFLRDLEVFCVQHGIELQILKGLDEEKSRALAIANCRLSGLAVTPQMIELLDRVKVNEISTAEAIHELLQKTKG